MTYIHKELGELGTAGAGLVVAAAANVAVSAHHAAKMSEMQRKFQRRLETDQEKMDWFRLLLSRFKSLSVRLATVGQRPGTPQFEAHLKKVLKADMAYGGNCNVNMYMPITKDDVVGQPRKTFAKISRGGYVSKGTVPKDVGPIWANGCKAALDEARIAYIKRFKGQKQFKHLRAHKEDIGTLNLALKFGTGFFLLIMMVFITRIQSAVIEEQAPPPRRKKRKKKKPR